MVNEEDIEPMNWQASTNIDEHIQMFAKINEVIRRINEGSHYQIDDVPTPGSPNLVRSGGVYSNDSTINTIANAANDKAKLAISDASDANKKADTAINTANEALEKFEVAYKNVTENIVWGVDVLLASGRVIVLWNRLLVFDIDIEIRDGDSDILFSLTQIGRILNYNIPASKRGSAVPLMFKTDGNRVMNTYKYSGFATIKTTCVLRGE